MENVILGQGREVCQLQNQNYKYITARTKLNFEFFCNSTWFHSSHNKNMFLYLFKSLNTSKVFILFLRKKAIIQFVLLEMT
jgi:hypothetical protein